MLAVLPTGIVKRCRLSNKAPFFRTATAGVAAPLVIYFALGERASDLLERLRRWMAHNNAVIMAAILAVIAAKIIGDAVSGLT